LHARVRRATGLDGWGRLRPAMVVLGQRNSHIKDFFDVHCLAGYSDLLEALQAAEAVLGRTINPTVMTVAQWRAKRAKGDSFAARVAGPSRVFVIGSEDDLG